MIKNIFENFEVKRKYKLHRDILKSIDKASKKKCLKLKKVEKIPRKIPRKIPKINVNKKQKLILIATDNLRIKKNLNKIKNRKMNSPVMNTIYKNIKIDFRKKTENLKITNKNFIKRISTMFFKKEKWPSVKR